MVVATFGWQRHLDSDGAWDGVCMQASGTLSDTWDLLPQQMTFNVMSTRR